MQNPLITAIIPTFRRPHLLKRAIASVMGQTYPHLRICVYDNASGDETETVVRECMKHDSRISYHRHDQNIGMMGNYLFALSRVNTSLFSVLSDDDLLLPGFYEEAVNALGKYPQSAFAATSTVIMTPKGIVLSLSGLKWKRWGYLTPVQAATELSKDNLVFMNVLLQRWTLEKGLLDFSNGLFWDQDFLLQMAIRYPIYISQKPGGIFFRHSRSFSVSQNMKNWQMATLKMIDRVRTADFLPRAIQDVVIQGLNIELSYSLRTVFSKLADRNLQDACFCLEIVRKNHGLNFKSALLLFFVKLSKRFSPTLYLFSAVRGSYNLLIRRHSQLQKNYGHYFHNAGE